MTDMRERYCSDLTKDRFDNIETLLTSGPGRQKIGRYMAVGTLYTLAYAGEYMTDELKDMDAGDRRELAELGADEWETYLEEQ